MSPGGGGVEARVAAVRRYLERRVWQAVALWCGAVVLLLLLAAWLLAGPAGWAQGSDVPLVLDLVLLAVLGALGAVAWVGRGRWFSEAPLSRAVEEAAGLEAGQVRGALELDRGVPAGVSRALARRAGQRTLADLSAPEGELSGRLGHAVGRWTRRGLGALTALALVAVLLAVASPERSAAAWSGLARPLGVAADPVLPPLEVTPGTVEVERGTDVEIRVRAPGRREARLDWQAAGDVSRARALPLDSGMAVHRFAAVAAPLEYTVRTADGAEAGPFRIVPVDPLFVSDLLVEVTYPPHTGLAPEEFRGEVPPLVVPAGTRLAVEGRASRTLGVAELRRVEDDGADAARGGTEEPGGALAVAFTREGVAFRGSWTPGRSGRYDWRFLDGAGDPAEIRPGPLELTLEADRAPTVRMALPGVDTVLPMNLRQPLVMEARDDYGLRRLELVARRITAFGEAMEPVVQAMELGGTRAALARPLLDLREWGLMPGDTVRYYARVVDNHPRGHTGRTREYVLRMPDAAEMRRAAEERIGEVGERLEELAREAGERAEETRDMERQARGQRQEERPAPPGRPQPEQGMGFEEREELRRAVEGQEELTAEVDSLEGELQDLQRTMEEAGQSDPELAADLQELQDLLREVADEELRERMRQMAEQLDDDQLRDARQAMEELAEEQQEFRERLEQSLERFRRAAVEQDFRATRSEAQEMAQEQEALADAMEEGDDPGLRAEQQEALQDRAEALQERMETLQERLDQLGEEDAARGVEEAREEAAAAGEEMERAGEQARQRAQDPSGAQRSRSSAGESQPPPEAAEARAAAQGMEEAAEQLDRAQQQMAQQKAQAAQEALRGAADDALTLARRQGELREAMQGAGREELVEMRGDQASLVQGLRNAAQSLQEESEDALAQNRDLSTQIGRAMQAMEGTVEAMGNRRGSAPAPQVAADRAVQQLNQLALMALAGAEQMSQSQQGQGQSSPQQTGEQLQQLAQQQGQVNNQSSQLTPMQLGEQARAEQLRRLAEQQRQVAEGLEELSEEPGAAEDALGDLQELAREAEALAREMAGGRAPEDMGRRQEQLFRRLLDSGRSLEREEYSDERESEAPGSFERDAVVPLSEDALGALRFRMPEAERLQRLPPAVRQLVIEYFERLNRTGGDGAPGPGGGS